MIFNDICSLLHYFVNKYKFQEQKKALDTNINIFIKLTLI